MRKILEERLENAKLDYQKCLEEIDYPLCKADELAGTIVAYQDCLNLLQPRTEQEILKDFEALGWEVKKYENQITLEQEIIEEYDDLIMYPTIKIDFEDKTYTCYDEYDQCYMYLTMQEHKLLNELFECYGWL